MLGDLSQLDIEAMALVAGIAMLAALGHWLLLSLYPNWPEWRIRWRNWRGQPVTEDDILATQGYRPWPYDPARKGGLQAISFGLVVGVLFASPYYDLPFEVALYRLEALLLGIVLLWSLRAPRSEVGMPSDEERAEAKPVLLQLSLLAALAAMFWFDPFTLFQQATGFNAIGPFFAFALVGAGMWQLRRPREEEYPGDALNSHNQGIAMLLFGMIVFVLWALS